MGSSVVLWSTIIAALFSGLPWLSDAVVLLLLSLLAVTGQLEFFGMAERRSLACFRGWGIVGGLLLIGGTFIFFQAEKYLPFRHPPSEVNDFEVGFLILFVLGLCLRQLTARDNPHGLTAIAITLLSLMYVPWLLNFIQKIIFFPAVDGRYYVLYFIVVTKFSDIGAYSVGSLMGRHKMIPRISPGKTWEGLAGALLFSLLASLGWVLAAPQTLAGMTVAHALALGLLLGAAAVVGDLIESLFKREAGLKDSGRLFPGIGGILDLLDSLLFNAPLMYIYLRYVMRLGEV
ncbi:MAG: phosphatidate cytidylyltransferase [Verrucomicrobiae bacterium]|nr:phosphatidate cytidylyltransferase [Verrucomicrobiae bacterium]